MLVRDIDIVIDADENTIEMMKYCNSHHCEGHFCPYWNECEEFELKHETTPFLFKGENGKLLTDFEN